MGVDGNPGVSPNVVPKFKLQPATTTRVASMSILRAAHTHKTHDRGQTRTAITDGGLAMTLR